MATALPLNIVAGTTLPIDLAVAPRPSRPDAMESWIAQELAMLTPEERARYDSDASYRDMVRGALEWEWRNPGPSLMQQEAEEKYGGDMDRCFVEQAVAHVLERRPAEDAARIAALRAQQYGTDFAREARDIQDGTHPVQRL